MVCDSIIKVAVMAVKEEVLWVGLASSTGLIEETRCPTIITTSWRPATRAHKHVFLPYSQSSYERITKI